jgi:hypothetical protein
VTDRIANININYLPTEVDIEFESVQKWQGERLFATIVSGSYMIYQCIQKINVEENGAFQLATEQPKFLFFEKIS